MKKWLAIGLSSLVGLCIVFSVIGSLAGGGKQAKPNDHVSEQVAAQSTPDSKPSTEPTPRPATTLAASTSIPAKNTTMPAPPTATRQPTNTPVPTEIPYVLELIASNGTISYGYITIDGKVRNISSQPQKSIQVLIELSLDDGTFVKSKDAFIDLNPVLPEETSTFKTMTDWNRQGGKYSVSFKRFLGGSVLTKDSRP